MSALTVGEEVVATLLGIRRGMRYSSAHQQCRREMVELFAGPADHRAAMAALHYGGVREVDFSIGIYAYKRRFGVTRFPLSDITTALGWRGLP